MTSGRRKPLTSRELRSRMSPERLELSLERVEVGEPGPGEVVVRVEAAPINSTDLSLLLAPADPTGAELEGEGEDRRLVMPLSPDQAEAVTSRMGLSLCPGLEGAGTVVVAGPGVESLVGRTVAMFGGGFFAEHRKVSVADCLIPVEGTPPGQAAASFVNPQTALAMVETLRREGHAAMVLTAAASSLGRMVNLVCLAEGIEVVNVVRSEKHVQALHDLGARHVCVSDAPDFTDALTGMIRATGATLAFDAIGGGTMASTILAAMEAAFAPDAFSTYGSTVPKQVYVYGRLDPTPLELRGGAGMAWSVSGWLMMNALATLDGATIRQMRNRIVRELDTTSAAPSLAR